MIYLLSTLSILVIALIICAMKIKRLRTINSSLEIQLLKAGVSLDAQKTVYNDLITSAKDSDSFSKLKRMKQPLYAKLQHINSIIYKNYFSGTKTGKLAQKEKV